MYVLSMRDIWKDDGHEKTLTACPSDRANPILEPARKAYTERNWDVFSRETARELSPEFVLQVLGILASASGNA